jgi:carboxylate-amine ligase
MPLDFRQSEALTFGVELELMVLNTRDFNLTRGASDLLNRLEKVEHPGEVKPEITESMIEVNSAVHRNYPELLAELRQTRDAIVTEAGKLNLAIAGGGAHPFHTWSEAAHLRHRALPARLAALRLPRQAVHGVRPAHPHRRDERRRRGLPHAPSRALHPALHRALRGSPYYQGEDTHFETSRLHAVSAFPLAGHMPECTTWAEFNRYFDSMAGFGIVSSMKDFYWDIRPKPEYGTVEIRICDTPLTVEEAAQLAAYAQTLSADLLRNRRSDAISPLYLVYGYNRFQASRFGYQAQIADPLAGERTHVMLRDDVVATITRLEGLARELNTWEALDTMRHASAPSERRQVAARALRGNEVALRRRAPPGHALARELRGRHQGLTRRRHPAGPEPSTAPMISTPCSSPSSFPRIAFALAILVGMAWRDASADSGADARTPLGGDGL